MFYSYITQHGITLTPTLLLQNVLLFVCSFLYLHLRTGFTNWISKILLFMVKSMKRCTKSNHLSLLRKGEYESLSFEVTMYKLKQNPRARYRKFSEVALEFGSKKNKCDHFVFFNQATTCILLHVVYVDDIFITGDKHTGIINFKSFFYMRFNTNGLCQLKYYLVVEVTIGKKGILLSH